jgi:putative oxidoreductase
MTSQSLRNPLEGHLLTTNATESKPVSLFDWADVIGRIGLALLFLWSGYGMFAHAASTIAYMQAYGLPAANILIWPTALFEVIVGAMLVLGWRARWAALALAAFTLVSAFVFHAYWSVPADQVMNQQIHFMKNLSIVGGLLLVLAHGCGRYALDTSGHRLDETQVLRMGSRKAC